MSHSFDSKLIPDFYGQDIKKIERANILRTSDEWIKRGESRALEIFKIASTRVPAYKDFLKKHGVNSEKIRTIEDFKTLPLLDKHNYIETYPLASRLIDGQFDTTNIIASSSGTTGHPNFWPRGTAQEVEAAHIHELLYRAFFKVHNTKTLLVIGFPMGVYVSGVATLLASWLVATKYAITLVSVGNNKTEMLKAVQSLHASDYEQVVLVGHPFFIKDVLETGKADGVSWKKFKVKLLLCSEGFSEKWREYIKKIAGIKDSFGSIMSTYGSSEFLLMGVETPMTQKLKLQHERRRLISSSRVGQPEGVQIFQYNPEQRYIESINNELVVTALAGVPLVRFNMHDSGAVISYEEGSRVIKNHNPKWKNEVSAWPLWRWPLVTLTGRSDHAIVFYAANIYPQHIHVALSHKTFFKNLTGKFTLQKGYLENMDEFLEIHVELKARIKPSAKLAEAIGRAVVDTLKRVNMEYLFLTKYLDKNLRPKVTPWPYNHDLYFKPGLKPRYIINE